MYQTSSAWSGRQKQLIGTDAYPACIMNQLKPSAAHLLWLGHTHTRARVLLKLPLEGPHQAWSKQVAPEYDPGINPHLKMGVYTIPLFPRGSITTDYRRFTTAYRRCTTHLPPIYRRFTADVPPICRRLPPMYYRFTTDSQPIYPRFTADLPPNLSGPPLAPSSLVSRCLSISF